MRPVLLASRLLITAVLLQSMSGCSWLDSVFPDRSKDYKKAKTAASLEVPPDLTATPETDALVVPGGETTLSGYTSARESLTRSGATPVLPEQPGMTLERDRDRSWLVVQGEPSAVWPEAREFWLENGFLIVREDPVIGVLETDWVESREYIPQGPIRALISRVWEGAYSASYQDRYRMRLEVGQEPGTTEVFVTHQGVQEKLEGGADDTQTTVWVPRPSEPGLESEMLKRMMIYLGVSPERAEREVATAKEPRPERAELIKEASGPPSLVIHEGFARAWRSVGITLDRVDFAVEDRDRSDGVYYVRYNDPLKAEKEGVLSKLAFWSDDDEEKVVTYQIKLTDDGPDTRVMVLNAAGEPETSVTAVRILTLLHEELR
ncbi:MAG: outer membrane protein assembly factor BamC [Gammaproteobacteria bacterium]|jgi:outer membrane protein assembly factor BamC